MCKMIQYSIHSIKYSGWYLFGFVAKFYSKEPEGCKHDMHADFVYGAFVIRCVFVDNIFTDFSSAFAVLSPEPNAFVETLRKLPILHDEQYAQQTRLYEYYKPPENTLVLS